MIAYLDTSAAMKLLVEEPESEPLLTYLHDSFAEGVGQLAAAWLLHTELHRAARRYPDLLPLSAVANVLEAVTLVDVTRGDLLTAGSLPGALRSHDAIHLAIALRIGVDAMIGYDDELQRAADAAGLAAVSPR